MQKKKIAKFPAIEEKQGRWHASKSCWGIGWSLTTTTRWLRLYSSRAAKKLKLALFRASHSGQQHSEADSYLCAFWWHFVIEADVINFMKKSFVSVMIWGEDYGRSMCRNSWHLIHPVYILYPLFFFNGFAVQHCSCFPPLRKCFLLHKQFGSAPAGLFSEPKNIYCKKKTQPFEMRKNVGLSQATVLKPRQGDSQHSLRVAVEIHQIFTDAPERTIALESWDKSLRVWKA